MAYDKFPGAGGAEYNHRLAGQDILNDYPHERSGRGFTTPNFPAVNVIEYDKDFSIEIAAPGLCKKDYDLKLDNDVLRVRSTKEKIDPDTSAKYSRREFGYREFEKTFILPDNADRDSISASCNDGVLAIHIPKKVIENRAKSKIIKVK